MTTLAEYVAKLRALPDDWAGYYRTEKPTTEAIDRAEAFIALACEMGCPPSRALASGDHGVGVCWFRPGLYADIEFYNDGEACAIVEAMGDDDSVEIWMVGPLNEDDLKGAIHRISAFLTRGGSSPCDA